MKVSIKEKQLVYDGFLKLEKATLRFEQFDGKMSEPTVRENCRRNDSAACLAYDLNEKKIVLVRQFRYPVYEAEPEFAWLLEIPAGIVEQGEEPKEAIMRELREEIHLEPRKEDVVFIGKFFPSPGTSSERIFLYALECDLSGYDKISGGLNAENEDIEIVVMPLRQVYEALSADAIMDGKTIMALQWLEKQVSMYVFG